MRERQRIARYLAQVLVQVPVVGLGDGRLALELLARDVLRKRAGHGERGFGRCSLQEKTIWKLFVQDIEICRALKTSWDVWWYCML